MNRNKYYPWNCWTFISYPCSPPFWAMSTHRQPKICHYTGSPISTLFNILKKVIYNLRGSFIVIFLISGSDLWLIPCFVTHNGLMLQYKLSERGKGSFCRFWNTDCAILLHRRIARTWGTLSNNKRFILIFILLILLQFFKILSLS